MIYHQRVYRNAFGILCIAHAFAHIGVLSGFVFWAAPITIWCVQFLLEEAILRVMTSLSRKFLLLNYSNLGLPTLAILVWIKT